MALFSHNCKIQNGCHRTSVNRIFVIFAFNFLVLSHWYVEIYCRCIVLMIWDITNINGTRHVIEIVGSSPIRGCNPLVKSEGCQNSSLSYIFVLIWMFSDKVGSFICRSLAVLSTWVYFPSFVVHAITQPIVMTLNWSMQSPGKAPTCHMQRKRCVMPWWL